MDHPTSSTTTIGPNSAATPPSSSAPAAHGGDLAAEVLVAHGVTQLFTLVGGHISPILVAAQRRGIRIVDVRDEATAVFAADAVARVGGVPGVAAVTAGPGVTNVVTAAKNAQLAESPVVIIGGGAATVLKGRGALQDIDQLSLFLPCTKWQGRATKAKEIAPLLVEAFTRAKSGVPGPVFVELPIDLLYPPDVVRSWYLKKSDGRSLSERALGLYLKRHVAAMFDGAFGVAAPRARAVEVPMPAAHKVQAAADALAAAQRPVLVVGSQALAEPGRAAEVAQAVAAIGAPVYLSGTARGLLAGSSSTSALQMRHKRKEALREADLVLLAGTPADFRLDYGAHISRKAVYVAAGRDRATLHKNRWPQIAAVGDAGAFLVAVAHKLGDKGDRYSAWRATLAARDAEREAGIDADAQAPSQGGMNPLAFCRELDRALDDDAVLIADGGDFVATASYIVRPRAPLSWLDPGVFGTLGVGAGFAVGSKVLRPDRTHWLLFGDGAFGWSMSELDTLVRHKLPCIAVIGNDGAWTQIARDQVELLHSDVATVLARCDYHKVADALGGKGILIDDVKDCPAAFAQAKAWAKQGYAVVINAQLGKTEFRKGSISV